METPGQALLILSTVPDRETGRRIARLLVEERWAACVSLVPGVESHYRWEGRLEQADECQLWIKTPRAGWEKLRDRLAQIHPYECPEIIAVEIVAIHAPYREWLEKSTGFPEIL
jgi:periplasmic divalent cation tolerance protein